MSNRPLVYYWIAHYNDGTSYLQFNPLTYKENKFEGIDNNRLIKFGLYPFSKKLAEGVSKEGNKSVSIEFLPNFEINVDGGYRVIYYRDVFISQESFHICKKCRQKFNFSGKPSFIIKGKDNKIGIKRDEVCAICPHCNARDYYECKECGRKFETFNDAESGMCPDCGRAKGYLKKIKITSGSHSTEKRWIEYYIGKQITVRGTNVKFLMKVQENGNTEIL